MTTAPCSVLFDELSRHPSQATAHNHYYCASSQSADKHALFLTRAKTITPGIRVVALFVLTWSHELAEARVPHISLHES